MTIKPNEPWGSEVERPADLVVVDSDAALAEHLAEGDVKPVGVAGGDLFRTLGARPIADRTVLRCLPLDVVRLRLDGGAPRTAVAHVVVRSPWWRGSWWRGPVSVVMNAEFLGAWDIAPRGHPNDGRVERFDLDPRTSLRQRSAIRGRLPSASHLPHPSIDRRVAKRHLIERERPAEVWADGRRLGRARTIDIEVVADGAAIHA